MSFTNQQINSILSSADKHLLLITTGNELFGWFENAVSGLRALQNLDEELALLNRRVSYRGLSQRQFNEWTSFTAELKSAYSDFGREVEQRSFEFEQRQVRNLALSRAADAFTNLLQRQRELLIRDIEATVK